MEGIPNNNQTDTAVKKKARGCLRQKQQHGNVDIRINSSSNSSDEF